MIKAVCFDLDGTLVASERLYLEGNVHAADELGVALTIKDFLPLSGISDQAFQIQLDQLIKPAQQPAFVQLTQAFADARIAQPPSLAQPGANHLLTSLQAHQLQLALVTTSAAEYTKRMLRNTHWQTVFDVVVSKGQGRTKPAPDLYLTALKQLQLPTSEVLAVEDSQVGVQAAQAAGLQCVQVHDLAAMSAQADQHVDNLLQLEKMILG